MLSAQLHIRITSFSDFPASVLSCAVPHCKQQKAGRKPWNKTENRFCFYQPTPSLQETLVIMKHRGGSVRQGVPRGRKSQSCEDVSTQGRSIVSQMAVNSHRDSEPISTSRDTDVCSTVLSQPDLGANMPFQPVAVRESSNCHDCAVEVQTHHPLEAQERERKVGRMHAEFKAKRKVVLSGLPLSCNREVNTNSYMSACYSFSALHMYIMHVASQAFLQLLA